MKRFLFIAGLAASMSSLFAVPVPLTNSQINPDPFSYINFVTATPGGNTAFTFQNGDSNFGYFQTASPSAPYTGLQNLKVDIAGTYDIIASTFTNTGGVQSASVVNQDPPGTEQLKIFGDHGGVLTADLQWVNIYSVASTVQGLNLNGSLNVTNINYVDGTGINADSAAVHDALQALMDTQPGALTLNVNGAGLPQVSNLLANAHTEIGNAPDGNGKGAFSLSFSTVPEPRFYGLLLVGLVGVAAIVIKRKSIA